MFFSPMIYDTGYSLNPYFAMTFGLYLLLLFIKLRSAEVLHILVQLYLVWKFCLNLVLSQDHSVPFLEHLIKSTPNHFLNRAFTF